MQITQGAVRLVAASSEPFDFRLGVADDALGVRAGLGAHVLRVGLGGGQLLDRLLRLLGAAQAQRDLEVLLGGADPFLEFGLRAGAARLELLVASVVS